MGINGGVLVQKPEIGNGLSAEEVLDGPSTSQFHVLAVDDSVVDRKFIEKLLRISAYKVTTVDSGRRALEYLGLDKEQNSVAMENIKVNMIITDYCMPGMTGYDLLKKIKESATFKEIPVVIMSSENIMPRINRCLEEGAEEFLLKPVKLSDVKRLKGHIVKGLSKDQKDENKEEEKQQPVSSKRKSMSDENDVPTQSSARRPRIGELSVA